MELYPSPSEPPPPYEASVTPDVQQHYFAGTKLPAEAVTQQPVTYMIMIPPVAELQNPPPTHLTLAIFVTLCCCWPIGIFAILRASSCKKAIARADHHKAARFSEEAKLLSMWALGIGIALNIILLALFVTVYTLFIMPSWSM